MTLGMIEGVLLMGMVGLIWMMLDHFVDDHSAKDTGQEPGALDHHDRMDQPGLPSPAQQKHEVLVSLPLALIERLRNVASRTGEPPLADLAAEAIEDIVTQMERINGEAFSLPVSPLKREAMTRRALSGPLR
jgi:predicted DNA-binding protein